MEIDKLGRQDEMQYYDILLYARSGAGKTYRAATAPKPFIVSPDPTGHRSVPYEIPGKLITHTSQLFEVLDWFETGQHVEHGIRTAIFDGLTFVFNMFKREVGLYFNQFHGSKDPDLLPIQAWQKIESGFQQFLTRGVSLSQGEFPVHVVCTTLEESLKEDQNARYQVRPLHGTQKQNDLFPALYSVISYIEPVGEDEEGNLSDERRMLFTEYKGILARDRTGTFPKVANPAVNLSDYLK